MIPCVHPSQDPYCRGCEACIKACTSCPFPKCRYELGKNASGIATLTLAARNEEIVTLDQLGVPVEAIAEGLGIRRRQVNRVLAG